MPKRKKHQRLPNGYGSIRYLGKSRRNPYAVHPPTDLDGNRPQAICYVDDWMKGFIVLTAYKAGTYTPGMEKDLELGSSGDLDALSRRILADYNRQMGIEPEEKKTFADVYKGFYDWKYNGKKEYSASSKNSTVTAYKNCAVLHNRIYADISYQDMQKVIDDCPLKHSSLELMVSLMKQMAKYAVAEKIINNLGDANMIKINIDDDDEHGVPFTNDELKRLWEEKDNPVVEMILIICYSGYRISAYRPMEVNTEEWYFNGGLKTPAGKGRIVPIHTAIRPLVCTRIARYGNIMGVNVGTFRRSMHKTLEKMGMEPHTPHDCRHTFSKLCEKYGVNENDRKRMMGHSFGRDITNGIYGHRTIEELREEIEKIKV